MSIISTGTSDWERPGSQSARAAYSVPEVAEKLGLSQASILRAIRRGQLDGILIGGRRVITARSLEKLLSADAA